MLATAVDIHLFIHYDSLFLFRVLEVHSAHFHIRITTFSVTDLYCSIDLNEDGLSLRLVFTVQ